LRIVISAPGRPSTATEFGLHLIAVVHVGDVTHEHGAAVGLLDWKSVTAVITSGLLFIVSM